MSSLSSTRQLLVILGLALALVMVSTSAQAEMVNGEDLVDPTAPFLLRANSNTPLLNAFASFNNYEVSSILIRPNTRIAIVNSQRVSVGDRVGNAEIIEIENDRVTIGLNGELREVFLHDSSIKTESGSTR